MTFADKLQTLRKTNNLSQDQLALELGVSRQSVSKWELGDSMPDVAKILQLADYFQVTTDYLLRDEMETSSPRMDAKEKAASTEDIPASSSKSKKAFLRAARICLIITILSVVLPITFSYLNGVFDIVPRLGTNELFMICSFILLRVPPVTGILAIIFWVLYYIQK